LLDLLDPSNCPAIQSSTVLTLVSSLLSHPGNTRTFETLDGLLVVTALFKSRATAREVKMKLVEFLYFYLMPETPQMSSNKSASASNTAVLGGRGKELDAAFERNRRETVGGVEQEGNDYHNTKTTEEKQKLLGKHLRNVDDLVEDLRESGGPFAGDTF
jgi:Cell division control protein 14, SIN component